MPELVRRTFEVPVPNDEAWRRLADVESWPSWAQHIRSVRLEPPGPLTAASAGRFHLRGGLRSSFHVTEFDPPRRWLWVGRLLTMRVSYDHRFEPAEAGTRLTWTVEGDGAGATSLGRLFARIYERDLDRAIPRLQAELEARG